MVRGPVRPRPRDWTRASLTPAEDEAMIRVTQGNGAVDRDVGFTSTLC
jgi:hypothetical protein